MSGPGDGGSLRRSEGDEVSASGSSSVRGTRYNRDMDAATQTVLTVSIPTLAVLVGILVNNSRLSDVNKRIDDLRTDISRQIADTRDILRAEMIRIEQVMDARLKHLEENR